MDYCDLVRVKNIYRQFHLGYVLGRRPADGPSIFIGIKEPDVLVRFLQPGGPDIDWFIARDLEKIGRYDKPDVSLKPETLVALKNCGVYFSVGGKPPDEPPVVIPPEPPPVVTPEYEIIEFERKENKATPVLVGSWVRNGDNGILTSPGNNVTKFTTGSKGEYGIGGYEAGYIREAGTYQVKIADSVFTFTTDGKQFIKLAWRETQQTERSVKLVSAVIAKSKALKILDVLNSRENCKGIFSVNQV